MANEEPVTKRFKQSIISDHINSQEFQDLFVKHWRNCEPLESAELCILTKPFRLCKISNFIKSEKFMEDLKSELADVKSRRQTLDLYQFEQTSDLANVDSTNLRRLWETFQSDFSTWMELNTTIKLNKKITMSSAVYYDTDYLLCHDDNMRNRRIAFVLYLSKDWSIEDGGSLDLFDTDKNGEPRSIVRSLVPEYNSLIFFEVYDDSYHQVGEVKSLEKSRWTINGWFHGPLVPSKRQPRPEIYNNLVPPDTARNYDLRSWIRNDYLNKVVTEEIQKNVEANSYSFLPNFFIKELYETLSKEITSENIVWSRVGPPDVRNYEIADAKSLPNKLSEFYHLFESIQMFGLLAAYTELDLVPSSKDNPTMSIELQRWSNGCYTLMADKTSIDYDNEEDRASLPCCETPVTPVTPTSPTCSGEKREERKRDGKDENNEMREKKRKKEECSDEKYEMRRTSASSLESGDCGILKRISMTTRTEKRVNSTNIQQQASSSSVEEKKNSLNTFYPDSDDSDVSDIDDYLSDLYERSDDERANSPSTCEPGSLDVIIQFNTREITGDDTIDYIDANQQDGALIHVPYTDNHLCLAYKALRTTRLHKYVNHYCKGYFYNLICTYHE